MTKSKAKALSSVYSDLREDGAKLQKTFLLPMDAVLCEWDDNIRPRNEEHIESWIKTMAKGDYVPPILVEMRDDIPYVIEGFHRHTAKLELLHRDKDADTFIECKEWRGDSADKLIIMRNSTTGLPLTFLEDAEVLLKIKTEGDYTPEALAERVGVSRTAINNKICIAEACDEIKELIREEKVSATTAIEFIIKHGQDALPQLLHAIECAANKGKRKATAGSTGNKAFPASKFRSTMELLAVGLDYEKYATVKDKLGEGEVDLTITLDRDYMDELIANIEDYVEYTDK